MNTWWTLPPWAPWLLLAALTLASCAAPPPPARPRDTADAGWSRTMKIGRTAYNGGQFELAGRFYRMALARGRAMDSAPAIADAAYNLAACRMQRGRYPEARALLKEARAEAARYHGTTGDMLLLEAKVAHLLGEPQEALALSEELLSQPMAPSTAGLQLQGHLLRGQIACEQGDLRLALAELKRAEQGNDEGAGPAINASFCALAGCICLHQAKPGEAAERFDRETALLKEARQFRKMSASLERAAHAYSLAGLHQESASRFFRAARSLYMQGDVDDATALAQKALRAAEEAGAAELGERIRALIDEMEGAAARRPPQDASFSQGRSPSIHGAPPSAGPSAPTPARPPSPPR